MVEALLEVYAEGSGGFSLANKHSYLPDKALYLKRNNFKKMEVNYKKTSVFANEEIKNPDDFMIF